MFDDNEIDRKLKQLMDIGLERLENIEDTFDIIHIDKLIEYLFDLKDKYSTHDLFINFGVEGSPYSPSITINLYGIKDKSGEII